MKPSSIVQTILSVSEDAQHGMYFINDEHENFVSYKDFIGRAISLLRLLNRNDVNSGSMLVIQTINPQATLLLIWACFLGGITPVPCAISYSHDHLEFLKVVSKTLSRPQMIFNNRFYMYLAKMARNDDKDISILDKVEIDEDAILNLQPTEIDSVEVEVADIVQRLILFSSGTTGTPKGVVYSDKNLIANISIVSQTIGFSSLDSLMSWLPLNHILGLSLHFIATWNKVNQVVLPTGQFLQDPDSWLKGISRHHITVSVSPNFGYKLCLDKVISENINLSSLRLLIMGAEPTSLQLINDFFERFSRFGLDPNAIATGYGLTEAQMVTMTQVGQKFNTICIDRTHMAIGDTLNLISKNNSNGVKCVSQGAVYNCFSLTIEDEKNRILPEDTIGLVHLAGSSIANSYLTMEGKKSIIGNDQTFNTLDIGFLHKGQLYITGRQKDMIIINGENLFIQDIDYFLETLSDLEGLRAIGVNYKKDDSDKIAILVLEPEKMSLNKQKEIRKKLNVAISRHFTLKVDNILFVDKLLTTTTGKIMRNANFNLYRDHITAKQ
ncbi:putative NRPS-encoding gene, nrsF (plasmid) [Levilactobacillus brevis KB290]|uniref:Putative NRPS-encoding gene, nrsF n=2 Tax=Lactobacillaceae TaxID=33958 RepID=M5B1N2_LEVBR|nr:AMP-binding protein [Levilactobacillus brevis]BAN08111.1 putative NRPS-encoding gene, nrsF [Levilactobacillus brevis KB290]